MECEGEAALGSVPGCCSTLCAECCDGSGDDGTDGALACGVGSRRLWQLHVHVICWHDCALMKLFLCMYVSVTADACHSMPQRGQRCFPCMRSGFVGV